jgi:hypothetical protein
VTVAGKQYTLGVLVQCNYRGDLQVLGAPDVSDRDPEPAARHFEKIVVVSTYFSRRPA